MKKITKIMLWLGVVAVGVTACQQEVFKPVTEQYKHNSALPVSISRFAPEEGSEGTEVMIYGENFSTTKEEVKVTINGNEAEVLGANAGRILVKVPANAGSGEVKVTVANSSPVAGTNLFGYLLKRTVSTLAGAGSNGYGDGTGKDAKFNLITNTGLAVDANGNVYVADIGNHCIRKITPTGVVTTLAGVPGTQGLKDGAGNVALFDNPADVAVDAAGNVYVADSWNWSLRKVTPDGTVTTVARYTLAFPQGVTVDSKTGNIYLVSALTSVANGKLFQVTPAGKTTEITLSTPVSAGSIVADSDGMLYAPDNANSTIVKINPVTSQVTVLAGLADEKGYVDGAAITARFGNPWGIEIDASNNLYVAGSGNHFAGVYGNVREEDSQIRKLEVGTYKVSTVAGGSARGYVEGVGGAARFSIPTGVAVDKNGSIYVLDRGNQAVRKIVGE